MNSMDLKTQLAQETKAKNQSVELATTALMTTAANWQTALSESAASFRADLRDELKKAASNMEEAVRAERQRWERAQTAAMEELEETKRRLWVWGPVAILATFLLTLGLTVGGTLWLTARGTSQAFTNMTTQEAAQLAEIRAQIATKRAELGSLEARVARETSTLAARRAEVSAVQARLTTYEGTNGELFVEILPTARPTQWEGRWIIQAQTTR